MNTNELLKKLRDRLKSHKALYDIYKAKSYEAPTPEQKNNYLSYANTQLAILEEIEDIIIDIVNSIE